MNPATAAPVLHVSLIGPPNAGKTTLFDGLTGANYKTVNYPGSTVTFSVGQTRSSIPFPAKVYDSPGITSLHPTSPDQQVTVDHLARDAADHLVIAVADATQLSRHLYLVDQLIESGFVVVLCVTMSDLLERDGKSLDTTVLSEELGIPVYLVDARCPATLLEMTGAVHQIEAPAERRVEVSEKPSADDIRRRYERLEAIEQRVIQADDSNKAPRQPGGWNWDNVLLHPVLAAPIFVLVMWLIFASIFSFAGPFMDGIDAGFGWLIDACKNTLPAGWGTDLLADGIIAGAGSVLVFLPQIIILFLFMGFLEDSGYLARGAMIIDKPLTKIGLNGKSFVPLLSGFACAIPAILATRTITSRRERLLTILIIPLMSCSARLPVYALLLTFLLRDKPLVQGLALAGLYFGGIFSGAVAATIISRLPSFRNQQRSPLLLELPRLRRPLTRVILISTFHRTMNYLKKAGPTILIISLGLWLLTHLPVVEQTDTEQTDYVTVEHSYAAKLGHFIEPVMSPMGLDWRGGVAMIMGFAAREVFVSSLVLMYRVEETEDEDDLNDRLLAQMDQVTFAGTDQRIFTVATAIGLLFFFTIALQCFPTVVTAKAEMGGWKVPLLQLAAFTGVAYFGAVIIVQGLRLFGIE